MFSPLSLAWHDTTTTEQTKAQLVGVKRSTAVEEDEELSFGNRGEEAGERVESHTHKWCIIMTIINCTCGYRCSSVASDAVPVLLFFCCRSEERKIQCTSIDAYGSTLLYSVDWQWHGRMRWTERGGGNRRRIATVFIHSPTHFDLRSWE